MSKKKTQHFMLHSQGEDEKFFVKKAKHKVRNNNIDEEDQIPENYEDLLKFREKAANKNTPLYKTFTDQDLPKLPRRL